MSGAPIPDVRHSAPFIDIYLKSNCSETTGFQDLLTAVYPVVLSPLNKGTQPTVPTSDVNSSELTTPAPTDLNSYYFYKVRCIIKTKYYLNKNNIFTFFLLLKIMKQSTFKFIN